MAKIPLYNDGMMPKAPGAAQLSPIPVGISKVDYSGLTAAAQEAYQQPLMPQEVLKGDRIAAEAAAEAVSNLGSMMQGLALKMAEVKNAGDVAEAEDTAMKTLADYQLSLTDDSDPTKWVGGLDKVRLSLDETLAKNSYTPAARVTIERNVERLFGRASINVAADAQRLTIRRAKQSVQNLVNRQMSGGDFAGAAQTVDNFGPGAGYSQEDRETVHYEIARRQRESTLQNFIITDPARGLAQLDGPREKRSEILQGMNMAEERVVRERFQESLFNRKRTLLMQGVQDIQSGAIGDRKALAAWVVAHDTNSLGMQGLVLDQADFDYLVSEFEGRAPKNTEADWNTFYGVVHGFDITAPKEVQDKREAWVRTEIDKRFVGPTRDKMVKMFDERLGEVDEIRTRDAKVAMDLLEREKKRGAFGQLMRPKTNAEGEKIAMGKTTLVVPPEVGWFWKRPGTPEDAITVVSLEYDMEEDPEAVARADSDIHDILQRYDGWLKRNPNADSAAKETELGTLIKNRASSKDATMVLKGNSEPGAPIPSGKASDEAAKLNPPPSQTQKDDH